MSHKFRIGDVCIIVDAARFILNRHLIGMECVIEALPGETLPGVIRPLDSYCSMVSDGQRFWGQARYFRLKRPPQTYDGDQAGDWDLMPWRPSKERVNE